MAVSGKSLLSAFAAVVVAAAGSAAALADVSQNIFVVRAQDEAGNVAEFIATQDMGYYDVEQGTYLWDMTDDIRVNWPGTEVEAFTLDSAYLFTHDDPDVALNFQILGGAVMANFTVTSAQLSFAAISNAIGRASAGITVQDLNGTGVTASPNASNPAGMYLARYNGLAPGGTSFADLLPNPIIAGPFNGNSDAGEFPGGGNFAPIGPAVADMQAQYRFTLSAGDLASGTSFYQIIPAPGALSLLGLGGLLAARRRQR